MKKIDFTKLFHLKKRTITILIFSVVIIAVLFFNWRYFEEMIAEAGMGKMRLCRI